MYQNDPDTKKISSSSKEVDPSTSMISMMGHLIQQQDCFIQQQERIMNLIEAIAPKKEEPDNDDIASIGSREQTLASTEEPLPAKKLKLYRAAFNGDWKVAAPIFNDFEEGIQVKISRNGDNALHIAAVAKRIDFVKKLLKKMNDTKIDLAYLRNNTGSIAIHSAATSGMVEIAKELMKNNKKMAMERDKYETLPIEMATSLGHKKMVEYLYTETKHDLSDEDRKELFVTWIEIDWYDVALDLLNYYPDLAFARASTRDRDNEKGVTALHVLAGKHMTFSKLANQNQRRIFKKILNFGTSRDVENEKQLQYLQLVECIWKRVMLMSHEEISHLIATPRKLIFDAAERGNAEFLSILIRQYPDLIYKVDNKNNSYSIFHYAVKHHQDDIFKLIHEIGATKEMILALKDKEDNNILHLAGMLAPSDRLNIAPGPAIQMQKELMWFQRVKGVVQPKYAEARNKKGLTPRALFTEEHKDLRGKGEAWMNNTAGSCMVVATLIATVAFAAAITVPGGNNGDTGFPIFGEKVSFIIFAISDAISLVYSTIAIVFFLSITTSSYAEKEFLWSLPHKLRVGMASLVVSMAAMMIVFSTIFFIFFKEKRLWIAILVTGIASTPVIVIFKLYTSLFLLSSHSFWDLFFRQDKISLLDPKKEKSSDQSPMANKFKEPQGTCSRNV